MNISEMYNKLMNRKVLPDVLLGLKYLLVFTISTVVISLVSFRELWVNDVFHIIFVFTLIRRPLIKFIDEFFQ